MIRERAVTARGFLFWAAMTALTLLLFAATAEPAHASPGVVKIGNAHANEIHGTNRQDVLSGRGGSDDLFGKRQADRLLGGWGDDWIVAGAGRDHIDGGPGYDVCFGNAGRDVFVNCEYLPDYRPRRDAAGGI